MPDHRPRIRGRDDLGVFLKVRSGAGLEPNFVSQSTRRDGLAKIQCDVEKCPSAAKPHLAAPVSSVICSGSQCFTVPFDRSRYADLRQCIRATHLRSARLGSTNALESRDMGDGPKNS
jgi:hypothetical protein